MTQPNLSGASPEPNKSEAYLGLQKELEKQTLGVSYRTELQGTRTVVLESDPDHPRTYTRHISTLDQLTPAELEEIEVLWKEEFFPTRELKPGEIIKSFRKDSRVPLVFFARDNNNKIISTTTLTLLKTRGLGEEELSVGLSRETRRVTFEFGSAATQRDYKKKKIGKDLTTLALGNTRFLVGLIDNIAPEVVTQWLEAEEKVHGKFTYAQFQKALHNPEIPILRMRFYDDWYRTSCETITSALGFAPNASAKVFLNRWLDEIVVVKESAKKALLRFTAEKPNKGTNAFLRNDIFVECRNAFAAAQEIATMIAGALNAVPVYNPEPEKQAAFRNELEHAFTFEQLLEACLSEYKKRHSQKYIVLTGKKVDTAVMVAYGLYPTNI